MARLAILILLAALSVAPILPCTSIVLRDGKQLVFGFNLDWNVEEGLVFVNQRSMTRRSIGDPSEYTGEWVSRFGSLTFNMYGRDMPIGGINEAGLIVSQMLLEGTRYPSPDQRKALLSACWIQYQLDTAADIAGVIASDHDVRIQDQTPLHYLVADRSGAVATIEFLDGRMVAHTGDTLPVAALTNSTYDESLRFIEGKTFRWWLWWPWGLPWGRAPLDRFEVAAGRVKQFDSSPRADPVDYAFDTLRSVGQGGATPTQWSIVYQSAPRRTLVHFRTRENSSIKTIDLSRLDFRCSGSAAWIDVQLKGGGDVTSSFRPYSRDKNLQLIRTTWAKTPYIAHIPDSGLVKVAAHPSASRCVP